MSSTSPAEAKHIPIAQGRPEHADLPSPYSMTPGGTIYSTTPGGTRIKYDRNMLMFLSRSPFSQTPPASALPLIPGVTAPRNETQPPTNDDGEGGDDSDSNDGEHASSTMHQGEGQHKKPPPKDDGDDVFGMEP
jgi:hypothetical protein